MHSAKRPILLIDDSEDDAELVTLALREVGVVAPIDVARDGEEACTYLFGERPLPVVVLLDLHMPKIDGFEVLRRIRREPKTRSLPTVMVTSSGHDADIAKAYALGVNSYVKKAVDYARYAEIARTVGHYWLQVNEHVASAAKDGGD